MAQVQTDRYRFSAPAKTARPIPFQKERAKQSESKRIDGRGNNEFRPICTMQ